MKKVFLLTISTLFMFTLGGCKREIRLINDYPTFSNYNKLGKSVKNMDLSFDDVSYKKQLDEALDHIIDAKDYDTIYDELIKLNSKTDQMFKKYIYADTLTNYDQDNSEYINYFNALNDAYYYYVDFRNNVIVKLSENDEYLKEFFYDYTDEQIDLEVKLAKKKLDSNYIALSKEIEDLVNQAEKIGIDLDSTTKDEELLTIMYDFINKNNELANLLGYDSYIDYKDITYNRKYSRSDALDFVKNVKKYILPNALDDLDFVDIGKLINDLSLKEYNYFAEFYASSIFDKDYYTKNLLNDYAKKMGGTYYRNYTTFFSNGNYVFSDNKNSLDGAYTNNYLCYFGPNRQSALDVVHEFGHYNSDKNELLQTKSLDLKEFYSQGNEFLFMAYLENSCGDNVKKIYNTITSIKVSDACRTLVLASALREYEELIYNRHLENKEEIKEIWDTLNTTSYNGILEDYWKVEIRYDVYYISYATSVIGALNLYELSSTNLNKGIETYLKTTRNQFYDEDLVEILDEAGLNSPFDEKSFENILKLLNEKR